MEWVVPPYGTTLYTLPPDVFLSYYYVNNIKLNVILRSNYIIYLFFK